MSKKYSVGIDLGTSNSCVSICEVAGGSARGIDMTQILAPNVIGEKPLLASALYIPAPGEYAEDSLSLPWHGTHAPDYVVGAFARERAALVPDRMVTSAKSWLCNPHVNRREPILPWQSELEQGRVSPFEASRRYLEHMRQALAYHLQQHAGAATVDDCHVVLTVPASFDEVARSLTHEAALAAGFGQVTLLEEPQAAFYAWIAHSTQDDAASSGRPWHEQVAEGDLILVCDVGGGTADFSLIAVAEAADGLSKNLELHRIAVGEHILLGGDNMDLALAHTLKVKIEDGGNELDPWQFLSLIHAARDAKEKLLSDEALQEVPIAVPSRSASLFAKTLATTLTRQEVVALLVEGYFPLTAINELPAARKSVGLQEYGLDYATEPAVSKHLARFLKRALENVKSDEALAASIGARAGLEQASILKPTAVLFNGGVFEAAIFRQRIVELLTAWLGSATPLKELKSAGLDIAVSRGAAYYGGVQASGTGIKIRAGTSRSYYLGMESPMPAVPGFVPPVKGICIVPQGTQEGTELELAGREFGLVTGEAVEFRFFSSTVRAGDRVGSVVDNAARSLDELAGLTLTLPPVDGAAGQVVPVTLHPLVTEVGTLELWMQHTQSKNRWKLEFNLRAEE
ncbi:MAG: Hsp70 family protein [Sterolibacteriaceae bacterium]|nr:Hsp70 family protein [Sterolibacteriaceae bacterium]MBK9086336.1 Hsp70 family protein [Sterolibacteriaceae bacterium]